jgi:hypothetical protein
MMKIISPKKIIVFTLIALVLILALPVQSTQASLPGQTVPTAKPRNNKSSDGSAPDVSATSTPEVLQNLIYSTQSPETTITTAEGTGGQAMETLAPGVPAVLNVAVTPVAQGNIPASDSNLIPFIFSSNPAPQLYQYLGYAIIAIVFILFLSYMIFKRNRKDKTVSVNKPG